MSEQATDAAITMCDYCQSSPRSPKKPGQRQSAFCSTGCCNQARKRRLGQSKPPPTNCAFCQGLLPPRAPHRPGRHQVYCGDECEDAAYRQRLRERKPDNFTNRQTGGSVQPGMRFGKLVIGECFDRRARVECDCGTSKIVVKHNLLAGDTVSCGCVRRGILLEARKRRQLRGELFVATTQHGLIRRGTRPKEDRRVGVCAILPNADEDDSPVCYLVSTRDKDTEHSNFDEARVEYLLRTGRMSA